MLLNLGSKHESKASWVNPASLATHLGLLTLRVSENHFTNMAPISLAPPLLFGQQESLENEKPLLHDVLCAWVPAPPAGRAAAEHLPASAARRSASRCSKVQAALETSGRWMRSKERRSAQGPYCDPLSARRRRSTCLQQGRKAAKLTLELRVSSRAMLQQVVSGMPPSLRVSKPSPPAVASQLHGYTVPAVEWANT